MTTPEKAIDLMSFVFDEEVEIQKKRDKKVDEEFASRRNDFKAVFLGSPAGRRVLSYLLNESGVFETSFTGNSRTFYNEGKRDIGLDIMDHCFNILDMDHGESE